MVFFYRRDGQAFVPSALARSPWEADKQNGIALGGLLAHLIDEIGMPQSMTPQSMTPQPMTTGRLIIDILSAAPFMPLTSRCQVVREGRRMQHVQAELLADGLVVARAAALRVRSAETPTIPSSLTYPAPETVAPQPFMEESAFGSTLDTRVLRGGLREPGPGVMWIRFGHEHVEGVALTPLVRVAVLGDFGSGLGSVLPVRGWIFPNLDISVHLTRLPEGEWLLIDAETISAGNGTALSSTIMADRQGVFARAHQTLFVSSRHPAGG